ncbi:uncharacterized protein BP01DRAFT_387635 [Aspergillus saccharolyticus JOP 1030-1]|uniref:Uncharacterized protein n=1 Tax=Aspergillus saccharolyticus JOP 1030-1 TaxID=1450539 RepID=A0A318Z151_9EURO|nr:hypothetical protein BP01DRAFT_387635 [Aspergillus saccharolyticus JOP 1030-1]PYH40104.1 hypothetical protein BP01DRAFT_387635 [Aspergillus saccharolyticus JOP 1030-1]
MITVTAASTELGLARNYSEFLHDRAQAAKRWEAIMNTYVSSADESLIGFLKLRAAHCLSQHYLTQAIDAGVGSLEAEGAAQKLERLTTQVKCSGTERISILQSASTLALSVYRRLQGQDAEAHALVRPSIKYGIHILSR